MKKTEWFDGRQKPVREGPYERNYHEGASDVGYLDYWNGKKWVMWWEGRATTYVTMTQKLPWRGLVSDPEAK